MGRVMAARGTIEILGVPVSVVDQASAIATVGGWIEERRQRRAKPRYVCACDVNNVMSAQTNKVHMQALRRSDMILPDGAPLVWVGRLRGESRMGHVPGPDLLPAICQHSLETGWSHYFYGGAEGVADKLAERMAASYPGLNVAGTHCPPFRQLTPDEMQHDLDRINASGADVVWIGLGCPKQEIWMHEHHAGLQGRVLIGVGAAFDFHSGRIERAPLWMRQRGLEWLHRLISEPRRLWRRYLVNAPKFVALSLAESAALMGRRMVAQLLART